MQNNDDKKLAEDHVEWYMQLLRSQFNAWLDITEKLMVENFFHGIKHGRELERKNWIRAGAAPGPKSGAEAGPDTGAGKKRGNENS